MSGSGSGSGVKVVKYFTCSLGGEVWGKRWEWKFLGGGMEGLRWWGGADSK